jgi:hypothetical protein
MFLILRPELSLNGKGRLHTAKPAINTARSATVYHRMFYISFLTTDNLSSSAQVECHLAV